MWDGTEGHVGRDTRDFRLQVTESEAERAEAEGTAAAPTSVGPGAEAGGIWMLALEDASPRLRICAKWFLSDLMLGGSTVSPGEGAPRFSASFRKHPSAASGEVCLVTGIRAGTEWLQRTPDLMQKKRQDNL